MNRIDPSKRTLTNSETALKYRDIMDCGKSENGGVKDSTNGYIRHQHNIKNDLINRISYATNFRSTDRLRSGTRIFNNDQKIRSPIHIFPREARILDEPKEANYLFNSASRQSQNGISYTTTNFRENFKQNYRSNMNNDKGFISPTDSAHRISFNKTSPKIYATVSRLNDSHHNDNSSHKDDAYRDINNKLERLTEQVERLTNTFSQVLDIQSMKKTAALSVDCRESDIKESKLNQKESQSVQNEPTGFWRRLGESNNNVSNDRPTTSKEVTRQRSRVHKKQLFSTQKGFEEDKESKADSSPMSKSSVNNIDLDKLSEKELIELQERIEQKRNSSNIDRSEITSYDAVEFKKKSKPNNLNKITIPMVYRPPMVRPLVPSEQKAYQTIPKISNQTHITSGKQSSMPQKYESGNSILRREDK